MINTLKGRIGGLESKVARLLQEKAKTDYGNSMIVLENFMSSSPRETTALLSAGSISTVSAALDFDTDYMVPFLGSRLQRPKL
jgi:hypothetical protein